jgi:alkylation response protein AidB-like acyl-CoA dehydrogenase
MCVDGVWCGLRRVARTTTARARRRLRTRWRSALSLAARITGATVAVRDGAGWLLTGTKCWIGLASIADAAIIWGQDPGRYPGFRKPTDTPGFTPRSNPSCPCGRQSSATSR